MPLYLRSLSLLKKGGMVANNLDLENTPSTRQVHAKLNRDRWLANAKLNRDRLLANAKLNLSRRLFRLPNVQPLLFFLDLKKKSDCIQTF